ncbi:hypothetical protein [Micrococcus sp. HMSC067E09]|uniref:hypothetical protein n=1 Tax=Micrococcus sp. HMSC067E09 TaxID=1739367 RepID=UPI00114C914F|nr:hypothetical protein [Micrococcus sp. HMSC067E09]
MLMGIRPFEENENCQHYDKGDWLAVDPATASHTPPEWRLATFSLVLPVPEGAVSTIDLLGQRWTPGRYTGVSQVDFPGHEASEAGQTPFMYSIYPSASRRFGETVAAAMGASTSSKDKPWEHDTAHHLLFDPESAGTAFSLLEPDGAGTARIFLRAAEFLRFEDSGHRRSHIHDFLVLHVMATDCTSRTLEMVSQSLNRPRNHVRTPQGEVSPLTVFATAAVRALSEALTHDLGITVAAGGFLKAPGRSKSSLMARPTRVVMALPGTAVTTSPALLSGTRNDAQSTWLPAERWAWLLATGADKYIETLPLETEDYAARASCGHFRRWTVWAEAFGLAVVRHDLVLDRDLQDADDNRLRIGQTTLLQLPQTRYVDIALLTMRQFMILGDLTGDLAAIGSTPPEDGATSADRVDTLYERLTQLEEVQRRMVGFRERHWFSNIPQHEIDTLVLLTLRDRSGVQRIYDDFSEELTSRQDVYRTQFTAADLERNRRRTRLREAEERAREESAQVQQKQNERVTLALAVVALALTVPAIVESFGFWNSPRAGAFTLTLVALISVIGTLVVYKVTDRRARKRERQSRER